MKMAFIRVNNLCFTFLLSLLLLLLSLAIIARSSDDCVYTVFVRTGTIWNGGTDSNISLTVRDADGDQFAIPNLVTWGGLMGPDHDYFERGNLDIFSGLGTCLDGPVCYMNLTSDGTGEHAGWYCNYVEVSSKKVHENCTRHEFEVERWLALDASPYNLTAIRDDCSSVNNNIFSVSSSSAL